LRIIYYRCIGLLSFWILGNNLRFFEILMGGFLGGLKDPSNFFFSLPPPKRKGVEEVD